MTVNSQCPVTHLDMTGTFYAICQVANAERDGNRMLIQSGNSEETPL
jgi:hypothetical protein